MSGPMTSGPLSLGAIPAGRYRVILAPSPKFESSTDPWVARYASAMPHLADIPNRSLIMIHWGNDPENTDGCILIGYTHPSPDVIEESRMAFEMFYNRLVYALNHDEEAWITVEG